MKTNKKLFVATFSLLLTGLSPIARAEDVLDFEAIVDDLSGSSRVQVQDRDPFAEIKIYAGFGFTTSYLSLRPEDGPSSSGILSGAEASFGIDLFSPAWQAEGALRSYNSERLDSTTTASLKEFDLKVQHTVMINPRLRLPIGVGLAARYLNVNSPAARQERYTTPSSLLSTGLHVQMNKVLGMGMDFSWRNSLIEESIDRSALTAALKVDAIF